MPFAAHVAVEIESVRRGRYSSYAVAFGAGVVGALAVALLLYFARTAELTELSAEAALGGIYQESDPATSWFFGLLSLLVLGGLFGLIYAKGFHALEHSSAGLGMLFGFTHWIVTGLLLGLLPSGIFALDMGVFEVLAVLAFHLVFGVIVGGIFHRSVRDQTLFAEEHRQGRRAA